MRRVTGVVALLAAAACRHPMPVVEAPVRSEVSIDVPVEGGLDPGVFRAKGLLVDIPPGWRGTAGPADSALVVAAQADVTGTRVEVWVYPRSSATVGPVMPRPRPGCTPLLADEVGSYRSVPLLEGGSSASCLLGEGRVSLVQGWYGVVAGREVHVEVIHPHGAAIEGLVAARPLLLSLAVAPP